MRIPRPPRLWLSALNDASIRTALAKLRPSAETLPMYYSALARSRADWLVGMNLSRLFTVLGRQAGYDGVLSVGRVQTPTLKLVVDATEIAAFVSVPYWAIDVSLSAGGQTFTAQWVAPDASTDDAGRCLQQPVAQQAAQQIRAAGSAQVVSVETERVREARRCCSTWAPCRRCAPSSLGWTCRRRWRSLRPCTRRIRPRRTRARIPATCPKACSPRCLRSRQPAQDRSLAAPDHGAARPLRAFARLERRQVTAHHGIIPTLEPANLSAMSEKERAVYRLIRAHYLAQFLPHHEFDRTVADLSCGQQKLVATGKQVVAKGWRLVPAEPQADEDGDGAARSQVLPALRDGMACQIAGADIKALKTMPPKPYTQGELIKAMKGVARFVTDPRLKQKLKDTTGIGTEATRANIISGLIARGYIVKKGRSIRASDAAFTLIDAVPAAIADPAPPPSGNRRWT